MPEFSDTVPVNLTRSFVQVPTNVYAYKKTVLDQVSWGQKIDESFVENYYNVSDRKLLYQFYGDSATGNISRIYECLSRTNKNFSSILVKMDLDNKSFSFALKST